MWLITRYANPGDPLQAVVTAQIAAEVHDCDMCRPIFDRTGAVPINCPRCGARRHSGWAQGQEATAALKLAAAERQAQAVGREV